MSVKTLAPIAPGIRALYVLSTKGSPFEQQHDTGDDTKPGGEDVGPPKPETQTPNSKGPKALPGGAYRRPTVSAASGVSRNIRYKRPIREIIPERGISVAAD